MGDFKSLQNNAQRFCIGWFFKNAQVLVCKAAIFGPDFFASWNLGPNLKPIIYIDPPVYKVYKLGKIDLKHIVNHEYDEVELALDLARRDGKTMQYMLDNYVGNNPPKNRELDIYGGKAHLILASKWPGGELEYDRMHDHEWNLVYRAK